jgi:DNA-binding NarL/FixJ family response regulator
MANLILVEDHALVRAGVRALLERSQGDHKIVGEAGDGHTAVRLAKTHRPDVAILDVTMPELNGIETARLIVEASPKTRAIMLSMHADPAFVRAAFDAGASGYVLKESAFHELEAAIRSAITGTRYLSPRLAADLKASNRPNWGPASPAVAELTRRERQILQLIGEAFSSPEIAEKLELSVRTIETYRQNMMNKLGLHSVSALTAFAIRHGLCKPDADAH